MANKKKNVNKTVKSVVDTGETISTSPQTISTSDPAFVPQISVDGTVEHKMYSAEDVKEIIEDLARETLFPNCNMDCQEFEGLDIESAKEKAERWIKGRVNNVVELEQENQELKKQIEELKQANNNEKKDYIVVLKKQNVNADYKANGFDITLQKFNQTKERALSLGERTVSQYALLMDVDDFNKKIKNDRNVLNYADFIFASK